jgi:putative flavoprotein involved in K+ transport
MLDCLIIGAGHSGLMCGHLMAKTGLQYLVVDAGVRVGDVWRQRPRKLHLFTSRQFCRLADVSMQNDPNGFPSGLEFADHIEHFANEKSIKLALNSRVIRLTRTEQGFLAELENGKQLLSKTVINATGSNQLALRPEFANKLDTDLIQLTAAQFQNAEQFPQQEQKLRIAVIGDGASGRQIALELAAYHQVFLARGRLRKLVPNQILGRDIFWWLTKLGILFADRNSLIARIMRKRDPIPVASANDKQLIRHGVHLKNRAIDASGKQLFFSDDSTQEIDAIIWCTGYTEDMHWIDLTNIPKSVPLTFDQGRTLENGFFVMGRKWLTCRASELVLGCEHDAQIVVTHTIEYLNTILPDQ